MDNVIGAVYICDDECEIVKITEDLYDSTVKFHLENFMKYESISIATNLRGSQESIDDVEALMRAIMKDGVSFAVKQRHTNELVAICINKIINPKAGLTLDRVSESFRSPSMMKVGEYLERMERSFDLFKEWHIDCVLEIFFLSTRLDFGRKGIAATLTKHSIELAQNMKNNNLSTSSSASSSSLSIIQISSLPDHIKNMKPQAVCSVFTSPFTQKLGEKLGFETLVKISHKEFMFEGKTFAEKMDPSHEFSTFAALRL